MKGSKIYVVFLAALALLLGLILVYSDNGLIRLHELRLEQKRLELDNEQLREENRRLLRNLERIKSDPRYIEDEARKKLGLVRPDETIYRLQDEPEGPRPEPPQPDQSPDQ
jgi:cell division protein FtsB